MHIAIIGGGLTGLTAAYELGKHGHHVTIFEKEPYLGGLAGGFKQHEWLWPLERSYHHFFTNDSEIFRLARELGIEDKLIIKRPVTATLCQKENTERSEQIKFSPVGIYPLDSPLNLLTFPILAPVDKLRTAALLAFCKVNPFWKPLERTTAKKFFVTYGGGKSWQTLWEPLMEGKFGSYSDRIAASWLWARIYKRTPSLGYFQGGFQTLIDALAKAIEKQGGKINIQYPCLAGRRAISNIQWNNSHLIFEIGHLTFDKVLITTPSSVSSKLIAFPKDYKKRLSSIPHLWAQSLILETEQPILEKTYWLNINDRSFPFIAVVAHTNFMDKKYYGGRHITYIGNYLPDGHPYLSYTPKQLVREFVPYLQKINPSLNFEFQISNFKLFTSPNAQPVHTVNYSKRAPKLETPIPNVYLANLDSIYPWDRGTNYAIELGKKAADKIVNS